MKKKIKKNQVWILSDQPLAYLDEGSRTSWREYVSFLLKIGTNSGNPMTPRVELISRCGAPEIDLYRSVYPLFPSKPLSESSGTRPIFLRTATADEGCSNDLDERKVSVERIDAIARVALYYARLILVSQGNLGEASEVLRQITPPGTRSSMQFEACVPSIAPLFGGEWIDTVALNGEQGVHIIDVPTSRTKPYLRVGLTIPNLDLNGAHPLTLDENNSIRIAANFFLTALLESTIARSFVPDYETWLPKPGCESRLLSTLIDAANDGRLSNCPWCGWPVLRKTPGASPYCRKSHCNASNKEQKRKGAKDMIKDGATNTEVLEKYPEFTYGQIKSMKKQIEQENHYG